MAHEPHDFALALSTLFHGDRHARANAVETLGRCSDPHAVEPLCAALMDEDWNVRCLAARSLCLAGDARAVVPLCVALKDANWTVRPPAAEALGRIGDPRAIEALSEALTNDVWIVRSTAARALGCIGDPRGLTALVHALNDADSSVRGAVLQALAQFDKEVIRFLPEMLRHPDPGVRASAIDSVCRSHDPQAISLLTALFNDPIAHVRAKAVAAMAHFGADGIALLDAALRGTSTELRGAAAAALAATGEPGTAVLRSGLRDYNWAVRNCCAEALGTLKDFTAVLSLCAALYDENDTVSASAASALGKIGDTRAIQPLCDCLRQGGTVAEKGVDALVELGSISVPALVNSLHSTEPLLRSFTEKALTRIGQPAANHLFEALADEQWYVRFSAAQVLGSFRDSQTLLRLCMAREDSHPYVRSLITDILENRDPEWQAFDVLACSTASDTEKLDALTVLSRLSSNPRSDLMRMGDVGKYCVSLARRNDVPTQTQDGARGVLKEIERRSVGRSLLRGAARESCPDEQGLLRAANNAAPTAPGELLRPSKETSKTAALGKPGIFARLFGRI